MKMRHGKEALGAWRTVSGGEMLHDIGIPYGMIPFHRTQGWGISTIDTYKAFILLLSFSVSFSRYCHLVFYWYDKMPPSFLKYLNVLLLLGFAKTSTSTATCYSQTGTPQGSNMIPCNSTANTGACCNVGGGDICTSAGLCLWQGDVPGFFYQDSCTDSTWGPTCPQFCGNSTGTCSNVVD
jgi:hypothetical protein